MIGLVDYDLQTSTSVKLNPPNLEIMKLATYYKQEENTFCRLISLDETELTSYDKIYFFSEKSITPDIPPQFLQASNVIYGGTVFTNRVYIPFQNSIIDHTIPRPAIYKEYLKQKYQDGIKAGIINHILDDTYYRCYAGNEQLPISPVLPKKRVFLYDREFFYDNWEDIIDNISERKPATIIRIHPIICNTLNQYFSVRKKDKIARTNEIILDLNIPLEEVNYMLKKYQNAFLGDILVSSSVYITLGGTFSTSQQYYKDFIYKMNLLYAFWSRNIPLKIKYIEPNIGVTDKLAPLSKAVAIWTNRIELVRNKSINERIILKSKKKSPAHEARDELIKFFPDAKDLFDQTYQQLAERRYWRL